MIKRIIHGWERKLALRDNNRVVRSFEWGTEFLDFSFTRASKAPGNGDSNGKSSRDVLYRFNDQAVSNSERFFELTSSPRYEFDGNWLALESPVQTPYPPNNTAYARYFPVPSRIGVRNGSMEHEVARARGRAVVVLPHWNAKPHEHIPMCRLLNRAGIAALRLSLPYHDRRMLPGFERADYMVSANLGRTLQANLQAVLDTRAAVAWLESQGYTRIGILGTSLGSCIAFLAFTHEPRIRVGVYLHVSSYFGDVVWEGLTTAHVRRGLETQLDREEVRRAWLAISPHSYVNRLKSDTRRRLLVSARYDLSFTPKLSRLLFDECDRNAIDLDRRVVPCGHYTLGRSPYKYYAGYLVFNYFRRHL